MDIYYKARQEELEELEEIFRKAGYTEEVIEEIEYMNGAMEIEDFIDNLESEKSYWNEY